MKKNEEYKWQKKDTYIVIAFVVVAFLQIAVYISINGFLSIGDLIQQVIIIMLAFVGLLEIFHYVGWDIFVPGFMLHKKRQEYAQEFQASVNQLFEHSMKTIIDQSLDSFFDHEANFIKDFSEEKTHFIMSQLGLTTKQFEKIRIELIKMRCLPLKDLEDAEEKIKQYIRCGEPFVVDLRKIDSTKCTYPLVNYYLNFNDAMFLPTCSRELAAIMHLLICEKIGISSFDKIAVPWDSNFILGVEVGKLLNKPVVHMRPKDGRIEKEKCWDGKLKPVDRVVIVHDVLVTSEQIIHTINKLPPSCQVVGLCCFVARKEWAGVKKVNAYNVKVERILDLNDQDIAGLM